MKPKRIKFSTVKFRWLPTLEALPKGSRVVCQDGTAYRQVAPGRWQRERGHRA